MMAGDERLPGDAGRFIDRAKPLAFTFEGRSYSGFAGDTVASALTANGVMTLSRSFKYHRPRGIMSLAGCEANTLVEVNLVPNVLAERHSLQHGDRIRAQNYAGSLDFDRNAWLGRLARFLPVGFYYRAFFRPRGAWRFWEPIIRGMAGIGRVDLRAPHGTYDKAYLFCDVAVVGGGAAGLSAALAAAGEGKRVVLIDENPVLGGALNYARFDSDGVRGSTERIALISQLEQQSGVVVLTRASCEGVFADRWLAVVQGRRLYKVRAGRVVLATGALEQPLVFRNNDLPGVMLGSAAQRLIRQYGVRPGSRAVVLTVNDTGYGVALDLAEAGAEIALVADLRATAVEGPLRSTAIGHGLRIETGMAVAEAMGRRRVSAVRLERLRAGGRPSSEPKTFGCDLLCMSGGFAPNLALAGHAGARLAYDVVTGMQRAEGLPDGLSVVGAANQIFSLDAALSGVTTATAAPEPGEYDVDGARTIFPHPSGKDFVDFDEDLTVRDIQDSIRAGFDDIQLLKRYSTAGMGPSQGRHSAINTIRIAAPERGLSEAEIGTTTARPPYSGETFGVMAGRSFDPVRRTPMHHRHLDLGAQMMPAGTWMRPAYYGGRADGAQAIAREVAAVRQACGLIDLSTLGKIEIRGPDAAEFLNRMYVTSHLKQPVGRARYAVMTDATGTITDDGVICRLADAHFFVTATTSGVEAVVRSMYQWNAQWRLDVDIAHVSAAYAAVNLAGPGCRAILARACQDIALSGDAFPYMAVRTGQIAGVPARVLRVGFVGELGYEIHVPAGCGEYLWDRLLEIGRPDGLMPFGVEAQRVLRLEKGHVIVGQDTDGLTNPLEIGMALTAPAKPFFVGHAALAAHRGRGIGRQLVGFVVEHGNAVPKECHLVIENGEIAGRVTSCVRSAAAGAVIGLAYVRPHQSSPGQRFNIRADGGVMVEARVVALPFYDAGNERQRS